MHKLKYGDSAERIRKMAARTKAKVDIPDPPNLSPMQELYLEAFAQLATERQIGMQEGPIPWSKIVQYADRHGFDALDMTHVLMKLDAAYLEYRSEESGNGNNNSSRPRNSHGRTRRKRLRRTGKKA